MRYTGVARPEESETRRLAKLTANGDDETCPACKLEMGPGSWQFHPEGSQWLCVRCHKRAKANDDVVVPISSKKPKRTHQYKLSDEETQPWAGSIGHGMNSFRHSFAPAMSTARTLMPCLNRDQRATSVVVVVTSLRTCIRTPTGTRRLTDGSAEDADKDAPPSLLCVKPPGIPEQPRSSATTTRPGSAPVASIPR